MFKNKSNIYDLAVILITIIITIVVYNKLPEQIPMHWNYAGEIDRYGSKLVGAGMPIMLMIGVWLMMIYLPKIDPRKDNYDKFNGSYSLIKSALITFFFAMQMIVISSALGYEVSINKIIPVLVGLLFIVIGNYLPKAKSNFFYGIKTPWTLSSEVSWRKTHRLGGRLFVLSGIVIIFASILLDVRFAGVISAGTTILTVVVVMVASYFYAKDE